MEVEMLEPDETPQQNPDETKEDTQPTPELNISHPASFQFLPTEVLFCIFKYVDSKSFSTLKTVCKRFNTLLNNDSFSKISVCKLAGTLSYPICDAYGLNQWNPGCMPTWSEVYYHTLVEWERWNCRDYHCKEFDAPHYASLDALKIVGNGYSCISGGRDRILCLWDVNVEPDLDAGDSRTFFKQVDSKSHSGWIWDIEAYDSSSFLSGGWDSQLLYWKLGEGKMDLISKYNLRSTVLAIGSTPGLVAAGLGIPKVVLVDPRACPESRPPLHFYRTHKDAIADITIRENREIVSVSQDKTLNIFDLRTRKLLPSPMALTPVGSPRVVRMKSNLLYLGDSKGSISVYNMNLDCQLVQRIQVGQSPIFALWVGFGVLICSCGNTVHILIPSDPPKKIREIHQTRDILSLDYRKGTLVTGDLEGRVSLYHFSVADLSTGKNQTDMDATA